MFIDTPPTVWKNFHFSQNVMHSIYKLLRVIEIKLSNLNLISCVLKKYIKECYFLKKQISLFPGVYQHPPYRVKKFHFSQNVIDWIFKLLKVIDITLRKLKLHSMYMYFNKIYERMLFLKKTSLFSGVCQQPTHHVEQLPFSQNVMHSILKLLRVIAIKFLNLT